MSRKQDGETKLENLTWEAIDSGAESEYDAVSYVATNIALTPEEVEHVKDLYKEWWETMASKNWGEFSSDEQDED